jgi:signal transduction histidine kinase
MKLEEHPFIHSISGDRHAAIMDEIQVLELSDGDIIFEENSEPDALFLILSGDVAFAKSRADGNWKIVSESSEGNFFGEVGVFTGEHRALAAMARRNCTVAKVPEKTVKKIIEDAEPVRRILISVIDHLKNTTDHYMDEMMRTEKLTLVGTMVSSLLHDFKNPFAIIGLGTTIINQQYSDDPKVTRICENIESQIRRMVNMANDLAAFARGESQIEVGEIEADKIFEEFQELNLPFFKDQSIEVIMRGNGARLEGDSGKLGRVLQNLISNSIEAIHGTDIEGSVRVEALDTGDSVTIKLVDNGPGIPESIRENFFEPFVTEGKKEGTGLGTAIAKSIIEAHHGEISFETGTQGTEFTIRLPKKQPVS